MDRYIGIDVHARSCTVAVVDAAGKRVGEHVVETNGQALVEVVSESAANEASRRALSY